MCTTADDSMQLLDLDSLFSSAPTLESIETENNSTIEDKDINLSLPVSPEQVSVQNENLLQTENNSTIEDKDINLSLPVSPEQVSVQNENLLQTENTGIIEDVDINLSLPVSPEQVSVQNERNAETINYEAEYLKILRCLEEKNNDKNQIQKDYDQLKVQHSKVMNDYAELYAESREHALEAMEAKTNFEKITEDLKISQHKIIAIENQYSVMNTMHQAALSNIKQLTKYVEKLESDVANSKNTNQSYKEAIKEDKKKYSTLKYKLKTYEEDLFSIAGKLDHATAKKNRDRETQRQIKKYCKKKNADLENIDSESVDTGRGSSFSNYSPAYSINFSPLNMNENFEQKMMKDVSTSPLPTNESWCLPELSITSPTFHAGTKPLENKSVYVDTSKENIKTVDTASSPITFVDDIKITTVDTASSPISFVDVMKKITTVDTASSPKLMDIAISPIYFANPSSPVPMSPSWESTASPIEFTPLKYTDVTIPAIEITDITRPEPTAMTNPVFRTPVITRTLKRAAVTSPLVQTPEITRTLKPAAVTSPLVQTPEITRPLNPVAVTNLLVQTPEIIRPLKSAAVTSPLVETPEITRPIKPAAVKKPVVRTPEMTKPFKPAAVTNPVVQTPEITRPLNPAAATNSLVQTPEITRPLNPAAVTSPVVQTPEITRPFKPAAVTNSLVQTPEITRPLNPAAVTNSLVQTPEITRPFKPAAVTNPVVQTPEITRPLNSTAVTNSLVQTPEITRLLQPAAVTSPVVQTPEITRPFKPAAVTNSLVQTPEITRPLNPAAVTNSLVQTPEITRPFKPAAVTNPVVQTPEITRPLNPAAVTNSLVQTPEITRLLKPAAVTSPVVQTPEITRPFKPAAVTNSLVQTPEITRPLNPAAVTNSLVQTPEITRPFKPAAVTNSLVQTPEITRPLNPAAVTNSLVQKPEITRLLKPAAVTSPVVQTPEITRPLNPAAVTNSLVQTPEITRPLNPAAVTNSLVQTPEITRLLKPAAVTSPVVQTPEITRPFKPAALTNPVVQTPEMTRPLQSADVVERSTDKTPEMNRSLDPTVAPKPTVKIPEMTIQLKPAAVKKHADLLTEPNDINDVKRQSLTTKVSEIARPFETNDFINQEASEHVISLVNNNLSVISKTPDSTQLHNAANGSRSVIQTPSRPKTSEHVINLVNNNLSVISKTPDLTQLYNAANVSRSVIQTPSRPKHAVARRPLIKTKTPDKTKQNENFEMFSSEKSLTKIFIEIQSHVAQDANKESDDDLEVRMILNKFRLDWNALSPMSITPDLDEEGLVQSKSDVRNDETERQSSEHSRSQTDSLLVITPDYKKLTVPQNKSNTLKHKINEDNSSYLNKNKVPKLHSIPPIRHTPVYNENERQSNKSIHLRKRKAPVRIYEKNSKRINTIKMPQELSECASNISSLESQSDLHNIQYSESNSLSQPSRNQLTQSQEPIKKEYLLKEKQIDSIVSKPPERLTPERIKATIPTTQSKEKSVPQTQIKLQSSLIDNMAISKEPQSNTPKPPERRRSERIKSTIPAAQSKTKSVPQTPTKLQSSPIDNLSILKEPQSNTPKPPERSERIKSTITAAQSKTKSVPQTPTKLQSSPIDNMSISKEPQSIMHISPERRRSERIKFTSPTPQSKTKSVLQTQAKLQSSPIDSMSISKEPQSNMLVPPEIRRSERIKSTIPTAQSKRNSVPQAQMKLQSSPIDNTSISKEPQTNTRSGCAPIISNPEYGRKRTICRSMEAQSDNKHSKRQKSSECDTSKLNSSEICSEDKFTFSKPPIKRISRVKGSVSTITQGVSNNKQSENVSDRKATTINKDLSCTPASKSAKLADDKTGFLIKPGQNNSSELSKLNSSEICSEDKFTFSKPPIKRISRVKGSVSTNTQSVPNNKQSENISDRKATTINKDLSCTPASKSAKLADDKTGFLIKPGQNNSSELSKLNSSEICSEDKFTFSKPPIKRISRVKGSVFTNTQSVPNNKESENISDRKATTINKDLSCTPASKTTKLTEDKTGFLIKSGQNTNENNDIKMSITHASTNTKNNHPEANLKSTTTAVQTCTTFKKNNPMAVSEQSQNEHRRCANYGDIDIFNTDNNNLKTHINKMNEYGYESGTHDQLDKRNVENDSNCKKIKKTISNCELQIANEIEKAVAACVHVSANPNEYSETLQKAVTELAKHSNIMTITGGLYRYLSSSDRKQEFVPRNKNRNYHIKPTPTKYVESLMMIIDNIDKNGLKLWQGAMDTCRFILFRLDHGATKSFDIVESVTHLFVNMCQYNERRNPKSVILFMLAAMYCANYKALIIIKNCLDLVPEILPHENEKILNGMNPLLQIFIFLLHFYTCKDEHGNIQNLRFTIKRRYGYDPTQENLDTILSKVKQTVMEINDHYLDNSMLQYSILILAKRKGTMWCHKNIVQNIIIPIIRGEIYASKEAFRFCLTIIAKLVKPYNKGMIVHSEEVVNVLMDIIEQPHPQEMKEEIISGLMCLNMENVTARVNTFLQNWNPPSMSPKLLKELQKYIGKKYDRDPCPMGQQIIGI